MGLFHLPSLSPLHRYCPYGVAVTVMVTFTGASMDSCIGSELEVVDAVSVPRKSTSGQGRASGGVEAVLRPHCMHGNQQWTLVPSLVQMVPTCWGLNAFPGDSLLLLMLPEVGKREREKCYTHLRLPSLPF